MLCMTAMAGAQSIDFNFSNAQDDVKCEPGYVAWNVSNKAESSSLIQSGCQKTGGFTKSNLTPSGKWIVSQWKK